MIVHNINPVLLKIGFLEIRYYSLAYIFGIVLAYILLLKFAKEKRIENLNKSNIEDLVFYLILGLLAGARIFYFVFYGITELFSDPLELFRVWHGGMSFHGALIGISISMYLFCRKNKVKFYAITDLLVIPAALALFVGRIMNFVNGELIGTKTDISFCIQYEGVSGCRHPSQIYEAIKNLFIFFVLYFLHVKKKLKEGLLTWYFVLLYGVLRFLVNFYRDDPRFFGISLGQYLSLLMAIIAIYFIYRIMHKK